MTARMVTERRTLAQRRWGNEFQSTLTFQEPSVITTDTRRVEKKKKRQSISRK